MKRTETSTFAPRELNASFNYAASRDVFVSAARQLATTSSASYCSPRELIDALALMDMSKTQCQIDDIVQAAIEIISGNRYHDPVKRLVYTMLVFTQYMADYSKTWQEAYHDFAIFGLFESIQVDYIPLHTFSAQRAATSMQRRANLAANTRKEMGIESVMSPIQKNMVELLPNTTIDSPFPRRERLHLCQALVEGADGLADAPTLAFCAAYAMSHGVSASEALALAPLDACRQERETILLSFCENFITARSVTSISTRTWMWGSFILNAYPALERPLTNEDIQELATAFMCKEVESLKRAGITGD